jgi:tRNA(fMet)-specific endonuclease VapC
MRNKPNSVIKKLASTPLDDLFISSITVSELQYGVEKSERSEQNRVALMSFLLPFTILNFDDRAAASYGIIRSELEKQGEPIGAMDYLIAAHAHAEDLYLVTNNEREFTKVPGLKTENWV